MARAPAVQVPYSPTGYARRSSAPKLRCHSDRSRSAREGEVEEPAFNVLTGHTGFPLPPGRNYNPYAMLPKAGYSTPMLHVADVARSIRFYELLGFELIDTEGDPGCLGWARVQCEGGALMFLLAEEPVVPSAQSILLAMYTPDLPGLREHLLANGVKVPPITCPGYMPSGQITFSDPDGTSSVLTIGATPSTAPG
jgi:catechol 2,3-dioxygenase-like lactoylglutathione lyase family enzyme